VNVTSRDAVIAAALLGLAALAGCGKQSVRTYRIPKEAAPAPGQAPAPAAGLPPDHPPIGASAPKSMPADAKGLPPDHPPIGSGGPMAGGPMAAGPMAAGPATPPALDWDAPSGWVQKPSSGMRVASYEIPGPGGKNGDLSIIVLGGGAGGLLPNVNRWLGQLGLTPWNAETLAAQSEKIPSPAGEVVLVDLRQNPPAERILGGILELPGQTWFFKLRGDDALAGGAKESFTAFLKSLKRRSGS
jgi:hypothetical protein